MLIQRQRIRQIERYLGGLIPETEFCIVVEFAHVNAARATRSGFQSLALGDTLLPAIVGRTSRFNAEGRYITHRDQPKESRFVGRREWTRQQWAGPGQTKTVTQETDVFRDCFPRTHVPAPGVELTIVEHEGRRFVVSPTLTWQGAPAEQALHTINLFLELFGEAEVRHADLGAFTPPTTQRVNWSMLPPGAHALTAVTSHVQSLINARAGTLRGPIMSRLTHMASLNPDPVFVGHGGFSAYVAYVFAGTSKVILESIYPENATYVFGINWQAIAQLNKQQVLSGQHHLDRIFHTGNWQQRVTAHAVANA